jgi:hypothetical protein
VTAAAIAVSAVSAGDAPAFATAAPRCTGAPKTVAATQTRFGSLALFGNGWITADGYAPVALPDGRTAWLMSDTLVAPATFVHNSIVVQRGHCLTPLLGGTADQRDDLIPSDDDRACWPSAGVARAATLQVFCTEVQSVPGSPGFAFEVVGTTIASFALPSLSVTARAPLPFVEPAGIRWGTGAVRVGDWVYVYGASTGAQYVARVRFDHVTTGPWRFWTGRAWGSRDALRPMAFARGTPVMPAYVTATDHGFVAVAFSRALPDPTIGGWTATRPQGPWRALGTVATATTTTTEQFAYDARAVDLGRAGWAIVYNVNDPFGVNTDPTVYGGRFVPAPARVESRRR